MVSMNGWDAPPAAGGSMLEMDRYGRQTALPECGREGQLKLSQARVLVVGLGGLGCPASLYLAATGIGHLTLVDDDEVALSNLHRQVLYGPQDVGRKKVEVARERLLQVSPGLGVTIHVVRVAPVNVLSLVEQHDIVLDGTDNFLSRYLLSDACVAAGRRLVSAAVTRFAAQVGVLCEPGGACYRCLYPQWPPQGLLNNCASDGVMGTFAGVVGTLMAHAAVGALVGWQGTRPSMLHIDGLDGCFDRLALVAHSDCPACRKGNPLNWPRRGDAELWPLPLPTEQGAGPSQSHEGDPLSRRHAFPEISWSQALAAASHGAGLLLVDVRESWEPEAKLPVCSVMRLPLSYLKSNPVPAKLLPQGRSLAFFCQTGKRSRHAVELVASKNSRSMELCHVAGGLSQLPEHVRVACAAADDHSGSLVQGQGQGQGA